MVRYLTFKKLNILGERCLLVPPQCVVSETDIVIVPKTSFSDIKSQKKLLILAIRGRLCADFGIRKICSHITIAGYLYNCFLAKINENEKYYKTKNGFYDMVLILNEINYAFRNGFDIFNELCNEEKQLRKIFSDFASRGSNIPKPFIYEDFKTKTLDILNLYRKKIELYLHELLNENAVSDWFWFIYGSDFIYSCYPYLDYKPSLKFLAESYKESIDKYVKDSVAYNIKELFKLFDKHDERYNYILLLNKWLGKRGGLLITNLFISICDLFEKFNNIANDCCQGKKDYDLMFPLFNYLMNYLNKILVDNFIYRSCIFYYVDLKRQLIEHRLIKSKFLEIYSHFSTELKERFFLNKLNDEAEVLKEYFFSSTNLFGNWQQNQQYKLRFIPKVFLKINFDWLGLLLTKRFEFYDRCSIKMKARKFLVESYDHGPGVLQVLKYSRKHCFICDLIKEKNYQDVMSNNGISNNRFAFITKIKQKLIRLYNNQSNNEVENSITESKRVKIFFDTFYIYIVANGVIELKMYYKFVFPSVDLAALILVSKVFNFTSIKVLHE